MISIIKGKRIHYTDSVKGYPVVLIHGYLETSDTWNGFKDNLTNHFRVIAVDLPGHGSSDLTGETQTMEEMASSVKGLIDNLGISSFFLIGHSLGGYVTLAFLEMFGDSLSGYCLFHSHPFPDSEEALEKRKKEISLALEDKKDKFVPANITRMFADSNLAIFAIEAEKAMAIASGITSVAIIAVLKGMMLRPSRLSVVEEGRVPFLWILGALDNYIPCDIMKTKVILPDNASLVILPNSGHMGFIEEQGRSVGAVKDFIMALPDYK